MLFDHDRAFEHASGPWRTVSVCLCSLIGALFDTDEHLGKEVAFQLLPGNAVFADFDRVVKKEFAKTVLDYVSCKTMKIRRAVRGWRQLTEKSQGHASCPHENANPPSLAATPHPTPAAQAFAAEAHQRQRKQHSSVWVLSRSVGIWSVLRCGCSHWTFHVYAQQCCAQPSETIEASYSSDLPYPVATSPLEPPPSPDRSGSVVVEISSKLDIHS